MIINKKKTNNLQYHIKKKWDEVCDITENMINID
jgi:hypothetical protein